MYDIYESSPDDSRRHSLGKSGARTLFTIGLNPSTATKEKSDTTVAKVEKVARQNGFDGFVMLNLYPVRATDYNRLPVDSDSKALLHNISHIERLVTAEPTPVVWAAWGDCIRSRKYLATAAQLLIARFRQAGVSWVQFGSSTAKGHPRHPSRLNYAWSLDEFDADSYAKKLSV